MDIPVGGDGIRAGRNINISNVEFMQVCEIEYRLCTVTALANAQGALSQQVCKSDGWGQGAYMYV